MEDDEQLPSDSERRHSFTGAVWKRLRLSKRKSKQESFVAYSDVNVPRESFISRPTNFERVDVDRQDLFLEDVSIQECPFDVTGYGRLIMKDKFKLRRPKRTKVVVFLFEKILILTKTKKNEELYYYLGSIKVTNLSLAPPDRNVTKILLRDFENSKLSRHKIEFKLEASTADIQTTWRTAIQKCLWQQLLQAKDMQNG